ncbi:MAG: hypothetical protein JRG79_07975 [Deltaproteobacteria bacterium]|nr:hypothetical protein [Deltaproteobacteria bacterium]
MGHVSRKKVICVFLGLLFTGLACLCIGMALFLTHPAEKGGADQVLVVREGWTLVDTEGGCPGASRQKNNLQ